MGRQELIAPGCHHAGSHRVVSRETGAPPAPRPWEARAAGSEPAQHLPPAFISRHVLPGCTQHVVHRQTPRMGGLQAPRAADHHPETNVRPGRHSHSYGQEQAGQLWTSDDSPADALHRPQPDLMKTRRPATRRSTRTPRMPKRTATCGRHHPDLGPGSPRCSHVVPTSRTRDGDADGRNHQTGVRGDDIGPSSVTVAERDLVGQAFHSRSATCGQVLRRPSAEPCNAQPSNAGPTEKDDGACGRFAAIELGTPASHGNGSTPAHRTLKTGDVRRSPTL